MSRITDNDVETLVVELNTLMGFETPEDHGYYINYLERNLRPYRLALHIRRGDQDAEVLGLKLSSRSLIHKLVSALILGVKIEKKAQQFRELNESSW